MRKILTVLALGAFLMSAGFATAGETAKDSAAATSTEKPAKKEKAKKAKKAKKEKKAADKAAK